MNDNNNNNNNVVGINGRPMTPPEAKPVSRTFEIVDTDKTINIVDGHMVVTPSFVAVANDEGNIDYILPMGRLQYAKVKESNLLINA